MAEPSWTISEQYYSQIISDEFNSSEYDVARGVAAELRKLRAKNLNLRFG